MTLSYERPDRKALARLAPLIERLAEDLAACRKRSQRAEAEAAELKSRGGTLAGPELLQVRQRIVELERANQHLRERMGAAREQLELLRTRLVFLESREGAA